jgi:hypothetical protein
VSVAFLVWLFRIRANAEILVPHGHRRAKPWLIFDWFVPIVSFWFPKQIVGRHLGRLRPQLLGSIGCGDAWSVPGA